MLVPPKGEAKLAALTRLVPQLLADPARRDELRNRARDFVYEKFSLQRMIDDYAAFYASLVD